MTSAMCNELLELYKNLYLDRIIDESDITVLVQALEVISEAELFAVILKEEIK